MQVVEDNNLATGTSHKYDTWGDKTSWQAQKLSWVCLCTQTHHMYTHQGTILCDGYAMHIQCSVVQVNRQWLTSV